MKKYLFFIAIALFVNFLQGVELKANEDSCSAEKNKKFPIVYHEKHNGALFDVKFIDEFFRKTVHPFDGKKYEKINKYLKKHCNLSAKQFYTPSIVSDKLLRRVHSQEYLDSLKSSLVVSRAIDLEFLLALFPNKILQKNILRPMKYGVAGTVLAVELAHKHGWGINLGGGYHHAKKNKGEGGTLFADIPLAVDQLREKVGKDFNVLIVDLDAHHGNGHALLFKDDPSTFIFDMFNKNEYPWDKDSSEQYVDFKFPLDGGKLTSKIGPVNVNFLDPIGLFEKMQNRNIDDEEYLGILKRKLPQAIGWLTEQGKKPNLVIYNAGTDPYEKDPWGGLNVSRKGIIERDQFVWTEAYQNEIPIAMVLSGGYADESAGIIGESLENILKNIVKIKT